jgi:two-component system, OmpR family, response regulator
MSADEPSTILVVEDDDATRTFLADNLTADGFDLLVADCARDGLRLLETKFPDLVLVDLSLPDASGFELVRRVREADGIASRVDPRTPLVVVSGRTSELDRIRGFDRGCDDYVCKPFSYPELRGRVTALLCRANGRPASAGCRSGVAATDARRVRRFERVRAWPDPATSTPIR